MVKPLFGGATPVQTPSIQPNPTMTAQVPAVVRPTQAMKPITVNEVMEFGKRAAVSIPAATDKITALAKTGDMDEMGKLLLDTLSTAKGYDPASMENKGFFKKLLGKAVNLKDRFDTVDKSVKQLITQVDTKSALFRARITDLDNMKEQLRKDYDALAIEIAEIIARCDWMDANVPVVDMSNPMEAGKVNDWKMASAMGRKRADDLTRLRLLFEQQAAQIDQMKMNSAGLAQKMIDLKSTSIPAMQSTFALYIINMEQKKGAEFATAMDKATNDAINQNAVLLGQNTTAIHTALTTSNIDLATLQNNQKAIADSLTEMDRIHTEMKLRLQSEAPQLEQLSRELAATLAK